MENPYPKDIFKWDNQEKLDFNRGRFNQHCFEVWENCIKDVKKLIDEFLKNGDYTEEGLVIFGDGNIKELKSELDAKEDKGVKNVQTK